MNSPKRYVGRKAAKATIRHSVRGTMSKARRDPPRTASLLSVGGVIGGLAGYVTGRRHAAGSAEGS